MHYSKGALMAIYRVVRFGTKTQHGASLCSKSLWPYFSSDAGCHKPLQTKVSSHVGLIASQKSVLCVFVRLLRFTVYIKDSFDLLNLN